jgi:RNA polymerase sigma-B factor
MAATAPMDALRVPADPSSFDERELLVRYHRSGDQRAREELVRRYLPATRQIARRYARGHESIDDLAQAATVGLIQAIARFDVDYGTSFATFAFPTMTGEVKRHLRGTRWGVHMPRGMQERTLEVRRVAERLAARLRRSPRPDEIAGELGIGVEDVLDALQAEGARDAVSLTTPHRDGEESGTLLDAVGDEDTGYERVHERSAVAAALRTLPERERRIIELRFGSDQTQEEIARQIGVSQMQVSRLLRRAVSRMRIVAAGRQAGTLEEAGAGK